MRKKTITWIDCAKAFAILSVLENHTHGLLLQNQKILFASYVSVTIFILIAGFLAYRKFEKKDLPWYVFATQSCRKIVPAYLLTVAFYVINRDRAFYPLNYLYEVLRFELEGTFYYVLLHIMLMLAAKPMFCALRLCKGKYKIPAELGVGLAILSLSALTTNFTQIMNVYGGGGKLLGGTFLFVFFIGMLLARYHVFDNMTVGKSAVYTVGGAAVWILWLLYICRYQFALDRRLPFGAGFNPPGVTLGAGGLVTVVLICGLTSLLERVPVLRILTVCVAWLGQHTLYVFLLHLFVLNNLLRGFVPMDIPAISIPACYLGMIFIPIALEYIISWLHKVCRVK